MKRKSAIPILFLMVAACLLIAGCGGGHSMASSMAMPRVTMNAQPASVSSGQSATLSWNAVNATSVTINPGIGQVAPSGSMMVTPSATTTYVASANGSGGMTTTSTTVTVDAQPASQFGHVVVVVEENRTYASVIGSSSMPYLNGLASTYGVATNYFANTHPSIGNYMMLTTGQIITNDDGFYGVLSQDNVVRELLAAGKTWKCYAESIPSAGYTGPDSGLYKRGHNPFVFFSDVVNNDAQLQNVVPFTQFATDLNNNQLPQYSFIVPNLVDDGHNTGSTTVDLWLKTNIDPLIKSATFQKDGLLIIVYDESLDSDTVNGGGQVAWVVVSPKAKPAYQSTTLFQHESTLRLALEGLGVTTLPGASASATDMQEFFQQ